MSTRLARSTISSWLWLIVVVAVVSPAWSQDKSKYFTNMHPENFTIDWVSFYNTADSRTAEARKDLSHYLDIAYGRHAKQKLDIYLPKGEVRKAPIFVFLHGGGFREGDRAHYGFVSVPLARHGIITVVPSYRLTGDGFHYPDQPRDVQYALEWIYRNIAHLGGDPDRIFISGHSAGAILSATVSVKSDWAARQGLPRDIIKGQVPISGPYDLRPGAYEERAGEADAYVNKPELRSEASPVANIEDPPAYTLVAIGGVEEKYMASSRAMVDQLNEKGVKAELLILQGMDHDQTAATLADEDGLLVQAILKMIQAMK